MNLVLAILGVLFLMGFNVGKALAIVAIVSLFIRINFKNKHRKGVIKIFDEQSHE